MQYSETHRCCQATPSKFPVGRRRHAPVAGEQQNVSFTALLAANLGDDADARGGVRAGGRRRARRLPDYFVNSYQPVAP
ncbi:MAG TPA: hypothetical protein GYA08_22970 [Chloroflexi bacterium]|nr:hypothetical protein [Chloroflexota bacterium]